MCENSVSSAADPAALTHALTVKTHILLDILCVLRALLSAFVE